MNMKEAGLGKKKCDRDTAKASNPSNFGTAESPGTGTVLLDHLILRYGPEIASHGGHPFGFGGGSS